MKTRPSNMIAPITILMFMNIAFTSCRGRQPWAKRSWPNFKNLHWVWTWTLWTSNGRTRTRVANVGIESFSLISVFVKSIFYFIHSIFFNSDKTKFSLPVSEILFEKFGTGVRNLDSQKLRYFTLLRSDLHTRDAKLHREFKNGPRIVLTLVVQKIQLLEVKNCPKSMKFWYRVRNFNRKFP